MRNYVCSNLLYRRMMNDAGTEAKKYLKFLFHIIGICTYFLAMLNEINATNIPNFVDVL